MIFFFFYITLQQIPGDLYERGFNVSPETILGLYVLTLMVGLSVMVVAYREERKQARKEREKHASDMKGIIDKLETVVINSTRSSDQVVNMVEGLGDILNEMKKTIYDTQKIILEKRS